jgi:capsular exopolysaccharide synthesis family protein
LILGIAILAVASALGLSFKQTPQYTSESKVWVKAQSAPGQPPVDPNMDTEKELAQSVLLAQAVQEDLGLKGDPLKLLDHLSVGVEPNTSILTIAYEDPKPEGAQRLAQAFADDYLLFRLQQTEQGIQETISQINQRMSAIDKEIADLDDQLATATTPEEIDSLTQQRDALLLQKNAYAQQLAGLELPTGNGLGQVTQDATLPASPSSPNYPLNGALALVLGVILGVAIVLLLERLDDRLRGRKDLEVYTGAPVLTVVPRISGWRKKDQPVMVTRSDPQSPAAEAHRTLRTAVLFATSQRGAKTIIVTSPHAGEGKSSTTANLGVALAQAGKRVVLVSADLRKPRLHNFFGVRATPGLTNMLAGEVSAFEVLVQPGIENLRILPSGPVPGNPAEILGSEAMLRVLSELSEAADIVLIDTPPVLAVADAIALTPFVDGLLFVVDMQSTTRSSVQHAWEQLAQVDAPIIGSVLNNFDPGKGHAYSYYYSSQNYRSNPEAAQDGNTRSTRRIRIG